MKRTWFFILAVALLLGWAIPAHAGSTSALDGIQGIADPSTKVYANVNTQGGLQVSESSTLAATTGTPAQAGVVLVTGACRVNNIVIGGSAAAAGDTVLVYDALSATGTPKIDVQIGTGKDPIVIPMHGAAFTTGVFVKTSSTADHVAIGYNQ